MPKLYPWATSSVPSPPAMSLNQVTLLLSPVQACIWPVNDGLIVALLQKYRCSHKVVLGVTVSLILRVGILFPSPFPPDLPWASHDSVEGQRAAAFLRTLSHEHNACIISHPDSRASFITITSLQHFNEACHPWDPWGLLFQPTYKFFATLRNLLAYYIYFFFPDALIICHPSFFFSVH